jgi:hypothetical protein
MAPRGSPAIVRSKSYPGVASVASRGGSFFVLLLRATGRHHPQKIDALGCPRNARSEVLGTVLDSNRKATHPRTLVRGVAQSPDIDEFALLLQPIEDTRRNYGGRTGKLIQL